MISLTVFALLAAETSAVAEFEALVSSWQTPEARSREPGAVPYPFRVHHEMRGSGEKEGESEAIGASIVFDVDPAAAPGGRVSVLSYEGPEAEEPDSEPYAELEEVLAAFDGDEVGPAQLASAFYCGVGVTRLAPEDLEYLSSTDDTHRARFVFSEGAAKRLTGSDELPGPARKIMRRTETIFTIDRETGHLQSVSSNLLKPTRVRVVANIKSMKSEATCSPIPGVEGFGYSSFVEQEVIVGAMGATIVDWSRTRLTIPSLEDGGAE
ncbi:MAG: hypothetical protein HRU11_07595 [Parvularculaceae bacterium]|nr:hypothetical protein [Parvularculaceae bacterium]